MSIDRKEEAQLRALGCRDGLSKHEARVIFAALTEARAEVERLSDALSASEGERDDLDTAVGTLLGENVELVAELATTRETLRRVEALVAEWQHMARVLDGDAACGDVPAREYAKSLRSHIAHLTAALAQSAQEEQ